MGTKNLEQKTYQLSQKYKPLQITTDKEEIKIPLKSLKYGILISCIGTIASGIALAYTMFPETIDNIIRYLTR